MARNAKAEQAYMTRMVRVGECIALVDKASDENGLEDVVLDEVRVKLDADNRTSVLLIVKGHDDDGRLVAFIGGPDAETALYALGRKLASGGLSWREDRPFGG